MARRAPFETTVHGTPVRVRRWNGYGKNPRLYVGTPDGERLGYWCLTTSRAVVQDGADAGTVAPVVTAAAAAFLDAERGTAAAEGPSVPPTPPAGAPSVVVAGSPAAARRPRVRTPRRRRDATTSGAEVLGAMDDDLAANRPGEALRVALERHRAALPLARRLRDDLSGATRRDPWRVGWKGERVVGRMLDRMTAKDPRWRVLHSIPDPVPGFNPDKDIDHLVIGPAGVFAVNTKHFRRASITIGDTFAWYRGRQEDIPAKAVREARRAGQRLQAVCGFPVDVVPVLAFVAPKQITTQRRRPDTSVFVVHHRGLTDAIRAHGGRPIPEYDVDTLYEAARRRSTWQA